MNTANKERLIILFLLVEFSWFIISGVGFTSLHNNPFFDIGVDIFYWIPFIAGVPQFIVSNFFLSLFLDATILLLLLLLLKKPGNHLLARILFIALFIFYITVTGFLGHRNYHTGIFLTLFPFLFKNEVNRRFGYEAIRYYLLWFYVSAGLFKLADGSIFNSAHLSNFLTQQFTPYYAENNTGLRTAFNTFLIGHNNISHAFYLLSVICELVVVVGFFTKRYDFAILLLLAGFHLFNWLLMDITFVGQLSFISLLMLTSWYRFTDPAFVKKF